MANYNVTITDGSGSEKMLGGSYSVSVSAAGFESTSLSPTSYVVSGEGTGNFTVSASGVLTLVFNESGAEGGTPVTSGSVIMTDSTGTVNYGSAVSIGATGQAVFNNVPYDAAGYDLYFVQQSTDADHVIYSGVISVSMDAATKTVYVANLPLYAQTFNVTSADYSGLPVAAATLTFTENAG